MTPIRRLTAILRSKVDKPYIAASDSSYIQLRDTELFRCKVIQGEYFCEESFMVKHTHHHTCKSAIFFNHTPLLSPPNATLSFTITEQWSPVFWMVETNWSLPMSGWNTAPLVIHTTSLLYPPVNIPLQTAPFSVIARCRQTSPIYLQI